MGKFKGEKNSAAAIFVHKDEPTNDELWNDLLKNVTNEDPLHVELVTQKAEFLANLQAWNDAQEFIPKKNDVGDNTYTSAMLLIHAHMGVRGIAPVQTDPSRIISWPELTACISKPLSLVWLFGCNSDVSKCHWTGKSKILLTCTTKERFRMLVPIFKEEASMRQITFFDKMLIQLRKKVPSFAYFTNETGIWKQSFDI